MINVTAIKLPESFDAYKNTNGENAEFLEPVSKINIFVGSNNSGKSRFMRFLAKMFIEDIMLKKNPKRKGGYKADSGTIKTKVDFCEKALPKIQYEDLLETTKEIVQNIYKFICSRNS